jgi:hypothetical protein
MKETVVRLDERTVPGSLREFFIRASQTLCGIRFAMSEALRVELWEFPGPSRGSISILDFKDVNGEADEN